MSREGPDQSLLGRTIAGKFAIESYVGGGAMGAVYKAKQIALDKVVAIKVMHRDIAKDEKFVHRFKREAKAASKLDHPNSLRVIDFGEDEGVLYIAMEFVDGRDLFHLIKEGWPLREERIVDIMMQALAALAVAHDQGIVHRDLKPENIMILAGKDDEGNSRDIVKVCDFGIAKVSESRTDEKTDQRLSTKGLVVGTPEYMSPEQGRGDPLDLRTDLYSMGIILFQLLTRQVPFEAENAIGVVLKHVTEEPRRPSEIYPGVNPRLEAICLKAIKKKPEERYQTAREMRAELRGAVDGVPAQTQSLPITRTTIDPRTTPVDSAPNLASAATIPIDSGEVVARSEGLSVKGKDASSEPVERPAGVPRRWTGFVLSAVLVAIVIGIGGLVAKRFVLTPAPAATEGTSTVTSPTQSAPPVTTGPITTSSTPSATNHVVSPTHSTNVVAPPPHASGKVDAGPHPSASASASAVPSASAATSTTVPPIASDAGAPALAGPLVRVGQVTKPVGLDAGAVRLAISAHHDELDACFKNGVKAGDAREAGTLRVSIEVTSTSVTANGAAPQSMLHTAKCIVGVVQHAAINGAGSADVDFGLVP